MTNSASLFSLAIFCIKAIVELVLKRPKARRFSPAQILQKTLKGAPLRCLIIVVVTNDFCHYQRTTSVNDRESNFLPNRKKKKKFRLLLS